MVNDQEPRYRLVDADGNVVGSLFAESDGTLKLQEGTSGNDNELAFGTDGELSLTSLENAIENRPHWSQESRTIVVGTDIPATQEAVVEAIPQHLKHPYTIDVSNINDTNFNLYIPDTHAHTVDNGAETIMLTVDGGSGIGGSMSGGSVYVDGFSGGICQVKGFSANNYNPFDNEFAPFAAYQSRVDFVRCALGSSPGTATDDKGFLSYTSNLELRECDIGSGNVDYGAVVKKMGSLSEQPAVATPTQGSANEFAYWAAKGDIQFTGNKSTMSGSNGLVRTTDGTALDTDNRRHYGVEQFANGVAVDELEKVDLRYDGTAFLQAFDGGTQVIEGSGSELLIKVGGTGGASSVARFNQDGSVDIAGSVNENSL